MGFTDRTTTDQTPAAPEWVMGLAARWLDWRRLPDVVDVSGVVRINEERMARTVAFIRTATVPFLVIPLFVSPPLARPWLVGGSLCAASAEAGWFVRRATRAGGLRDDTVLAVVDVVFCMALMLAGSRAGQPAQRNAVLTEVVPFSLVAPVTVAFTIGLTWRAVTAVAGLAGVWCLCVLPNVTQKLASDVLGFAVWFLAGLAVATLLRGTATDAAAAVEEARRSDAYAAEQRRLLDLALHRERLRSGLHDGVLPIFDGLALDHRLTAQARRVARQGALRARALLSTVKGPETGFETRVLDLTSEYLDLGLMLTTRVYIDDEPPRAITEALLRAAREALTNALKYAGPAAEVVLFAQSDPDGAELSVMDAGPGFDLARTARGIGYRSTLPAVESVGGNVSITTAPGHGTKVTLSWSPGGDPR